MGIIYPLMGLIMAAIVYLLGKNKHLSMYLYYSFNLNNLSDKEKEAFAKSLGYYTNNVDADNTIWAYVQLFLVFIFWPIVLVWLGIIKILGKFIKPKDDTTKK